MRILYLDCGMGAAGDMLTGALLELCPDPEAAFRKLQSICPADVSMEKETTEKCGIRGTHVHVYVHGQEEKAGDVAGFSSASQSSDTITSSPDAFHSHDAHASHHHAHVSMQDIRRILSEMDLPSGVRDHAENVYRAIAKAESQVHGHPVEEVHFHEVGALDAVMDVVSVSYLLDLIRPDRVVVSPVRTGFGSVRCAHGILSVPAPATAFLLKGIPTYSGEIEGEMCTPTGAALIRTCADSFGHQPLMRVEQTGIGMGTKDFPQANCVRAFLGENESLPADSEILELRANLDDMTGEEIGYAVEKILSGGALDVFTTPITMKKNRPAVLLTVLCRVADRESVVRLIFRHTSTLGVRETRCRRYELSRQEEVRETSEGDVRVKCAKGYGVQREKAEFDDLRAIAERTDQPLSEVKKRVKL